LEGFEKAQEAPFAPNQQKPPAPLVEIRVTTHVPEWKDDDSVREAACSRDEKRPPKKNLHNIASVPSTAGYTATNSSFSTLSNPSTMLEPGSGQTLLSIEIQLQPDTEHKQAMFFRLNDLLTYVQVLDPSAMFAL
jgi:hypothetical protein